ncbi:MAG TPA: hypothetical protein ENG71_04205 [Thermoplasmatales archaeon]|nr:hypothetical protein [Thermoplasmatales archaeon]
MMERKVNKMLVSKIFISSYCNDDHKMISNKAVDKNINATVNTIFSNLLFLLIDAIEITAKMQAFIIVSNKA